VDVQVLRSDEPADAISDPYQIRPMVLAWRDQLSRGLGSNIERPLDWDETAAAPYFTDKPGWDCYSSLLLWAAYSEHPGLSRPRESVEDFTTDAAFQRSSDPGFRTAFAQLLSGVEIWLPPRLRVHVSRGRSHRERAVLRLVCRPFIRARGAQSPNLECH
jgi:hypothetical protein